MRRNFGRSLTPTDFEQDEDVDPNSSISNVADCMLVLAVGLLVALVAHYNVDLGQVEEVVMGQEISVSDINGDSQGKDSGKYEELGTVYKDSSTGSMYLVTPGQDSSK